MTLIQALILSILQGASELFPVSSLGHAVIIPTLLRWPNAAQVVDPNGPFLPFIVTLHLGTALALLIFYWKEWKRLLIALAEQFTPRGAREKDAKMVNLLVVGTIPTAVIGLALEHKLRILFASAKFAAIFLIINGLIMIGGEMLRRRAVEQAREDEVDETPAAKPARIRTGQLTYIQALAIGAAQSLALLPGISRSGVTITGGLLARLGHEDAANFSFMLATPIILAAGIKEVPKLRHADPSQPHMMLYSAIGFVVSGITAYLSVKFLTKYFETNRLDPFGYYCIVLGVVTLAIAH
jgi:undecaprenyl-diphosphatase